MFIICKSIICVTLHREKIFKHGSIFRHLHRENINDRLFDVIERKICKKN